MNAAKTHAMLMHNVQIIMVRSSVVVIQVIKAQDFYALVIHFIMRIKHL